MTKDHDDTGSPPADGDGKGKPACVIVNLPRPDDGWTEDEKAVIDELVSKGMKPEDAKWQAALQRQAAPERDAATRRHTKRERDIDREIKRERKRKRKRKKGGVSVPCKSAPSTHGTAHTPPSLDTPQSKETVGPSQSGRDAYDEGGCPSGSSAKPTLRRQHPDEYGSWCSMKRRRNDGITVDKTWLGKGGFERFLRDLGPQPTPDHTLDRKDTNLRAYGPGLCRWATKKEQTRNRRVTVFLTDRDGVSRSLTEWAEVTGVSRNTLKKRYYQHRDKWTQHDIIYGRVPDASALPAETFPGWPGDDDAQARWAELYRRKGEHHRSETKAKFVVRWCRGWMRELTGDLPPIENSEGEEAYVLTDDELGRVEDVKRLHATAEKYDRLADPKPAPPEPEADDEADVESEFGYYGLGYEYD